MEKFNCTMKKAAACLLVCCMAALAFMAKAPAGKSAFSDHASGIVAVKAAADGRKKELPSKIYKKIKGWWADNSSGGYNRKITKQYVKVYDRATGKLAYKCKIYGWKNTSQGYLIKLKYPHNKAKYCYVYNEEYDSLEYYESWTADGNSYSGSASMERMK